jgi:uncharacterized repeat protein (TIGR04138 family)
MGADEKKSEPAGSGAGSGAGAGAGSGASQDQSAGGEKRERSLQEIVDELSLYPLEAFRFVEEGLSFAANEIHGPLPPGKPVPAPTRHISGQQLCEGLRRYALLQWGLLAQTVLRRWNITCTLDFGRIVFALIDAKRLQKTDHDSLDDFRNVFDFRMAFERDYNIEREQ